ncbi:hypothetical protein [Arthrobacter sp. UYCo732]|uniref:hypothetical protein n=1 Tax=Arthrobacter sp. UYCo732 TaxID=3156336 RepID=UPI003395D622
MSSIRARSPPGWSLRRRRPGNIVGKYGDHCLADQSFALGVRVPLLEFAAAPVAVPRLRTGHGHQQQGYVAKEIRRPCQLCCFGWIQDRFSHAEDGVLFGGGGRLLALRGSGRQTRIRI